MSGHKEPPQGWRSSSLSDALGVIESGKRPRGGAGAIEEGIPSIGGEHLTDEGEVFFSPQRYVPSEFYAKMSRGEIEKDDVLIVKDGATTGKVALVKDSFGFEHAVVNEHVFRLRGKESSLLNEYLYYFLRSSDAQSQIKKSIQGSAQPGINTSFPSRVMIPLPPLAVQERIADVLQQADAIRHKRAEARRLADLILPAAFNALFGDVDPSNSCFNVVRLGEVADIKSGVTKGRRFQEKETVSVPYLRVANVQDGFLDLTEIKTISVPPSDVEKLLLEDGDILMTEGGDPDKLGRGCIWRGQIVGCIHQNHIFRVRPQLSRLLPEFLAGLLRTSYAKGYFFRAAKRTSNLASINSAQVKNFTIPLPPMEMQRKFLLRVEQWDKAVSQSTDALRLAESTFTVLLARAFTGELTAEWETANADWIAERQAFYERLPRMALLSLLLEHRQRVSRKAVTLITALMKYAFLLQMEGNVGRRFYQFVPYHYGPFAKELYADLRSLQTEGFIAIDNDTDENKTSITLADPAKVSAALVDLPDDLKEDVTTIIDAYGNLDHNALLKAVYNKYPTYAKKSLVRKNGK